MPFNKISIISSAICLSAADFSLHIHGDNPCKNLDGTLYVLFMLPPCPGNRRLKTLALVGKSTVDPEAIPEGTGLRFSNHSANLGYDLDSIAAP